MVKIVSGNICAPRGFLAAGVHVGIRKNSQKQDLALIYSQVPAVAAGVFTLNQVKAAPVIISQQHIKAGKIQAIVINSGNANACTGTLGMQHAKQMVTTVASHLNLAIDHVAVASTGVIGVILPIEKITEGIIAAIPQLAEDGGDAAAQAIMTTDTFCKSIAVEIQIEEKTVTIGGIAKGSGMIHPNMATMLGFITTDVVISQPALQQALTEANQTSFNMITVDGDTSTNDMVLALANGSAANPEIKSHDDPAWKIFYAGLAFVCNYLAKKIAQDGEGATKLIEVQVTGAITLAQARLAARAVCLSPLVKTAIFGNDANWGRIASALGASGAVFNPDKLNIAIGDISLMQNGTPLPFDEAPVRQLLKQDTVVITANLNNGTAQATAWGCDLTYDYIKINASYRS